MIPLLLLLLLACTSGDDTGDTDDTGTSPPLLADDFEAELAGDAGGCSDVVIYAQNADDTVALFFRASDVVEPACRSGAPYELVATLPDAAIELRVEQGTDLTDWVCDDVMEEPGPVVARTWTPLSGDLSLTLTPEGDENCDGFDLAIPAELVLTDVVFGDGEHEVTVESLTLTARVGWLPG